MTDTSLPPFGTDFGLTPFGEKKLDIGTLAANVLAQNCPKQAVADKWLLLRQCITAKSRLGVSDRALTVLSALLSCHKETELRASDNLIVFPSNKELSRRAHGISEPTLRRALAQLVTAQLLVRRDSPNGKRYARRDADGEITRSFGFDLRPLLARAADITLMAEEMAAERREMAELRERITLTRRDIGKLLAWAATELEDGRTLPFSKEQMVALYTAFNALPGRVMRHLNIDMLADIAFDVDVFLVDLTKRLKTQDKVKKMNGIHIQNECHKQDSNQNPILESEFLRKKEFEEKSKCLTNSQSQKTLAEEKNQSVAADVINSAQSAQNQANWEMGPRIKSEGDDRADGKLSSKLGNELSASYSGLTRVSINSPSSKVHSRVTPADNDRTGGYNAFTDISASRDNQLTGSSNNHPDVIPAEIQFTDKPPQNKSPDGNSPTPQSTNALPLSSILAACPTILDYSKNGIGNWGELIDAARVARGAMGISPSAWFDAERAMGSSGAAVTIATILQRYDEISSPGGYLRSLSDKAVRGKFTPLPVVQSLLRRHLEAERIG